MWVNDEAFIGATFGLLKYVWNINFLRSCNKIFGGAGRYSDRCVMAPACGNER